MISFKGKHFLKDIILLVVRWYLSYSLSFRDIEEMMLERGIKVDHSTLNRWVAEYAPLLENEFRKNHKKKTGSSLRMDETYIKIKGVWHYLCCEKLNPKNRFAAQTQHESMIQPNTITH